MNCFMTPDNSQLYYKLAIFLHTLTCRKEHCLDVSQMVTKGRSPSLCYFYTENILPEDQREDTRFWTQEAVSLSQDLQIPPDDLLNIFPKLLEINKSLIQLLNRYPSATSLARQILFANPSSSLSETDC